MVFFVEKVFLLYVELVILTDRWIDLSILNIFSTKSTISYTLPKLVMQTTNSMSNRSHTKRSCTSCSLFHTYFSSELMFFTHRCQAYGGRPLPKFAWFIGNNSNDNLSGQEGFQVRNK